MNKLATLGATLLLSTLILGCGGKDSKQFIAEGTISDAEGKTLYLEEVGTGNILALDSARLDADGSFRFTHDGTYYPMFFRLRLQDGSSIPFAADSISRISIKANGADLQGSYTIVEADQYNHHIREINMLKLQADKRIDSLVAEHLAGKIGLQEVRDAVDSVCIDFKSTLTTRYIYVDPKSPASYFALFQRKGDGAYFSTEDEGDDRAFAAVATSYDAFYASAPYTPFLKDMALRAVARRRARRNWEQASAQMQGKIESIAFPEIKLRDNKGEERSLTTIADSKTVLLRFTAYSAQWSPMLVANMRKLHEAHPELTIYEVSVDGDSYYWENATRTLPWISVNDPEGKSLQSYNVQALPAFFVIKGGQLRRISSPEEALR